MAHVAPDTQPPSSQDGEAPSGNCQVCDRRYCLVGDGTVRRHFVNSGRCLGSRRPPRDSDNGQPAAGARNDTSLNFISADNLLEAVKATSTRTLPHIPKAARHQAATKLTSLLTKVNNAPGTIGAWHNLLLFGNACLALPPRRDKTLATSVIRVLNEFPRADNLVRLPPRAKNTSRRTTNNSSPENHKMRAQITRKIEEGNTTGAIRIITSDDTIAPRNATTAQALQDKHPPRAPDSTRDPQENNTGIEPLTVRESEVYKAAMSFPTGSAGGFTGLRPQHIKQMLNPVLGDAAKDLLVELTRFSNMCLAGSIPEDIRPLFYGAALCALKKKDRGIRPIAVGNTLRRLVAKAAVRSISQEAATLLKPNQLGFGIPLGCEAAAHAARAYIADLPDQKVLVKLDFKNAFNQVRRDAVLRAVHNHFRPLYPFIRSCYSGDSKLLFGEHEIDSCEGVQQGDPLAPLLFCLAIKEVTDSLTSELNIWYLDDGTLAGTPDTILEDIRKIQEQGAALGLILNVSKCEIVSRNPDITGQIKNVLPDILVVEPPDCTLLGAPIGPQAIEEVLDAKIADLRRMLDRIDKIDAHDALFLLTRCLSLPKLTYFLRCSPSYNSPKLNVYDTLLRSMLVKVLNLPLDDSQWEQATLPVRLGGLGVRTASQIVLPAFLSSSHASHDLVRDILPELLSNSAGIHDPAFTECSNQWDALAAPAPIIEPSKKHKQSSWDHPLVEKIADAMLSAATSDKEKARLRAVLAPHAGDFLLAVPMSAMGTRLDPESLRVAVALRLGAPIHTEYKCICNRVEADQYGLHGLHCGSTKGWHARHNEVNDIIKRSLASAQCPAVREPRILGDQNPNFPALRPDGITIQSWKRGKQLVWDYTCVSTLADTYVHFGADQAGGAANHREIAKSVKYRRLEGQYTFVPIASETHGPWGKSALGFLKELGSKLIDVTRDPRAASFLFQRLSVAIQRGNACCILGSRPEAEELQEIHNL